MTSFREHPHLQAENQTRHLMSRSAEALIKRVRDQYINYILLVLMKNNCSIKLYISFKGYVYVKLDTFYTERIFLEIIHFLFLLFTLPIVGLTLPRYLQLKCPWVICLYGEWQTVDQNTRQIHKGGSFWMCGQYNDRTEHKGHTPSPRIEVKISEPAGNRTLASGLEGKDSIDHTTTTDNTI